MCNFVGATLADNTITCIYITVIGQPQDDAQAFLIYLLAGITTFIFIIMLLNILTLIAKFIKKA